MAYCHLCSRPFSSETALEQHLRPAFRHRFDCHRCRRHFETGSALDQHLHDSLEHNICSKCEADFGTDDDLVEHEVGEHNLCVECSLYFGSRSDLRGVSNSNTLHSDLVSSYANLVAARQSSHREDRRVLRLLPPPHSSPFPPGSSTSRLEPATREPTATS